MKKVAAPECGPSWPSTANIRNPNTRRPYTRACTNVLPDATFFGLRCNDTPVVREILEETPLSLRGEGELSSLTKPADPSPERIKLSGERWLVQSDTVSVSVSELSPLKVSGLP
jgi:hypothetical protein